MLLKQQLNMSNTVQEQLRTQMFDLKDKVGEFEHKEFLNSSSKEMMQREVQ